MVDARTKRIFMIMARGRTGRPLTLWLCSFLGIGTILIYAGVPLGPIVVAGVLTLAVTLVRFRRSQHRHRDLH